MWVASTQEKRPEATTSLSNIQLSAEIFSVPAAESIHLRQFVCPHLHSDLLSAAFCNDSAVLPG